MSNLPTRNVDTISKSNICRCPLVYVMSIMRLEVLLIFKQIKGYVSGITYQRVKAYCKYKGVTQSELVRIAVADYLNKEDYKERMDI